MPGRTKAADHVTAKWLAQETGVNTQEAECFHQAFFHVVETALRDDQVVVLPGFVYGPTELADSVVALDTELPDDSAELWTRPGHEIARLLGLIGRDMTSIATLSDLVPAIRRKLHMPGRPISDRAFVALVRSTVGEIEAEREHLIFNLGPVDRESSIEDWVLDRIPDIGALMDMPSLEIYRSSTGRSGRQWRFANGRRADLVCRTAQDSDRFAAGTWLVIELKARHGAAVDVDQIYEYVELIQDELAAPDEVVLGCLLADGFDPATLSYINEIDVPIVLQTLVAIGFHDARFADAAIVGSSLRGSSDAAWTGASPTPQDLPV